MNATKKKQTHRYREQTSGYQWGEGRGRCKIGVRDYEVQTIMYKINKLQGCIVHTGTIARILTINGI